MDRVVELYGSLRELSEHALVTIALPDDARSAEVRRAIVAWRASRIGSTEHELDSLTRLLERTVVAAEDTILTDDEVLGGARRLALLPPVCVG